jgi:DNA repair photolyase
MKEKIFKGKTIYEAGGKAAEYGKYAFSAYVGCSFGCTYCFNKTGRFKSVLGGNKPTLKKCFKDEAHAIEVFEKELKANLPELQKHGLFFTFTSDPFLPETCHLTMCAIKECHNSSVPIKVLTKAGTGLFEYIKEWYNMGAINKCKIAFGFTLTGHDDLEPNASTNAERIEAMRKLHEAGFKTWASIEPIIDFKSSIKMIENTIGFCDLYKIGLLSGKKYDKKELNLFIGYIITDDSTLEYGTRLTDSKFYFKDSILKQAGINREDLPENCVKRDYNLFNNK